MTFSSLFFYIYLSAYTRCRSVCLHTPSIIIIAFVPLLLLFVCVFCSFAILSFRPLFISMSLCLSHSTHCMSANHLVLLIYPSHSSFLVLTSLRSIFPLVFSAWLLHGVVLLSIRSFLIPEFVACSIELDGDVGLTGCGGALSKGGTATATCNLNHKLKHDLSPEPKL